VLTPSQWNAIADQIEKGNCVPFLGAGINAATGDYPGLPLGGAVAERLARKLGKLEKIAPDIALVRAAPNPGVEQQLRVQLEQFLDEYKEFARVGMYDLARVAQRYESEVDTVNLITRLREIIPDEERDPSPALRTLARIPFKLIVTTNFDRLLEHALELIRPDAVTDGPALVAAIEGAADPVSALLKQSVSFGAGADRASPSNVSEALNDALCAKVIYEQPAWDAVTLRAETKQLLAQHAPHRKPAHQLRGVEMAKLNRMLLEDRYVGMLERDCNRYRVVVQTVDPKSKRRPDLTATDDLIVYKIHGTFGGTKGDATRLVVTEEDYIEFLTFVGPKGEGIPRAITGRLTVSSLLFLGYSLEDWNFRALFKGLIEKLSKHDKRKSFAIQKGPSTFWQQFWERKDVKIIDADVYEFTRELETQYLSRTNV
jgi:SIR2-like domain